MKIHAKEPLRNFKGEPLQDQEGDITVGAAISNMLLGSETGGKMKMFVLAEKFYKDEYVTLDPSDLTMVKDTVEKDKVYTNNLVSGQILIVLQRTEVKE